MGENGKVSAGAPNTTCSNMTSDGVKDSTKDDALAPAFEAQDAKDLMDGLTVTEDDLVEARELASTFSLHEVREVGQLLLLSMKTVY